MSKTDGGSAFPYDNADEGYAGMSLRDWFAGMAMHEMFVSGGWSKYKYLAEEAYAVADAMLKEKEAK